MKIDLDGTEFFEDTESTIEDLGFSKPSRKPSRYKKKEKKAVITKFTHDPNSGLSIKDTKFDYKKNKLNPFKVGDKVLLNVKAHERYSMFSGLTSDIELRVNLVYGNNFVNLTEWDIHPPTVKTVPVEHVKLINPSLYRRFVNLLKSIFRRKVTLEYTLEYRRQ